MLPLAPPGMLHNSDAQTLCCPLAELQGMGGMSRAATLPLARSGTQLL